MSLRKPVSHNGRALKLATLAFGMVLALGLLSACGGQQTESESGLGAGTATVSTVDTSSWKTLGDALSVKTEDVASGWDDAYYIVAFKAGDSLFRVVAKSEDGIQAKTSELDFSADNYEAKLLKIIGGLKIVSVDDLTAEVPTQGQLDAMVGKTSQELIDDGWAFQSYSMTDGEETGAIFTKGYVACNLTFDTKVSSDVADSDESGDNLKGAKVTAAENAGVSEDSTDPTKVR